MKPFKERIRIYLFILGLTAVLILGLLVTGYDYRKSDGFYPATDREPMSFSEAITILPSEITILSLVLLGIILIVECFLLLLRLK